MPLFVMGCCNLNLHATNLAMAMEVATVQFLWDGKRRFASCLMDHHRAVGCECDENHEWDELWGL